MTEDFDKMFYKMLLDESVDFRLELTKELFRFKGFPKIDEEEMAMLSRRTVEFLRFNTSPITPQLLEIEREAEILEKVLELKVRKRNEI